MLYIIVITGGFTSMKKRILIVTLLICVVCLSGCLFNKPKTNSTNTTINDTAITTTQQNTTVPETPAPAPEEQQKKTNGHVIVIDPGHQTRDSREKEPVGPGSSEMKQRDTSGATGVSTGIREYELTLQVANKLKDELESRGYEVILTRTVNEGEISCVERAEVANNANADAFIRIHANSIDDSSVSGAMTICQTSSNPYNGNIYNECKRLSVDVLDEYCAATGARRERVWETDSMTGNNWSKVPVTLIEMGYMSNPGEDELMVSDDYQSKIVQGIANGIDKYINE